MIKYALKRLSTNQFIGCGNGPDGYGTSTELTSENVYDSKADAIEHIEWMRFWAKRPNEGPKVVLAEDDVIELYEVEVTYKAALVS